MSSAEAYARLTVQIRFANRSGMCVVCYKTKRRAYRDGSLSMTCLSERCLGKWLPGRKDVSEGSVDGLWPGLPDGATPGQPHRANARTSVMCATPVFHDEYENHDAEISPAESN